MTKDHSDAHKAGPDDAEHPVLDHAPVAVTSAPEESPAVAYTLAPIAPVIAVEAVIPAYVPDPGEPFGVASAFFIDSTPFAQKSLEIWEENLGAFLGHMQNLASVKTFEEVVALQTRFATDCFESFGRQSRDLVALTQKLASAGVAPLSGVRPAA
jgi:hypothetical protein